MKFTIGGVVNRTLSLFFGNFLQFLYISIIYSLTLGAIFSVTFFEVIESNVVQSAIGLQYFILAIVLSSISIMALYACTITRSAISFFEGENLSIIDIFSFSTKDFIHVIAIFILIGFTFLPFYILGFSLILFGAIGIFGISISIILLVFFVVIWSVVVPVRAYEKTSVVRSFVRSQYLTKGHRWKIFFLFMMYIFVSIFFITISTALEDSLNSVLGYSALSIVIQSFLSLPLSILTVVMLFSLYIELRRSREGGTIREVAAIFD